MTAVETKPAKKSAAKKSATKKSAAKGKVSAKSSMKEAANKSLTAPIELAKEVKKSDGPCEAIRTVAKKFKSLKRHDVLEVAKAARINKFTASRQFHLLRSGAV